MSELVLAEWRTAPSAPIAVRIIPDGCRDLILRTERGVRPVWLLTDLDDQARLVSLDGGVEMHGIRLRAGLGLHTESLIGSLNDGECDLANAVSRLGDHLPHVTALEALACIASEARSVAGAAADLGVSARTLQRLVLDATGRSPSFWLLLARVRRAARASMSAASLGEIAYAHGFSDQAHMSREFRRWLGVTPRGLRSNDELAAQLLQPGYG